MSFLSGLFGSDAPDAPDPYAVSEADSQGKIRVAQEQAKLNALDQFGPYGSSQFIFDPETGVPIGQRTTLNPAQQALLDSQTGTQTGVSNAASRALSFLPGEAFSLDNAPDTSALAKTSFDRQMGLLAPEWEQSANDLGISLSERGIPVGSEIYNAEMGRYDRAKNASMTSMSDKAFLDAGSEQQRQIGNMATEYQMPLSQLQGLMGISQPAKTPGFAPQSPVGIAPTDTAGNVWNAYNAQVKQAQDSNANLSSMIGAGLMLL